MIGTAVCMAAGLLGPQAGHQWLPGEGLVYIVQIEPRELDERFLSGRIQIQCSISPKCQGKIRCIQVRVGTAKLPCDDPDRPPIGLGEPVPSQERLQSQSPSSPTNLAKAPSGPQAPPRSSAQP